MDYDAIVIGGSYAGMAAAMQLARARRHILVLDEGLRRNRFAEHSHGFLTQDGERPEAIAESARSQLLKYPNVEWIAHRADSATGTGGKFLVSSDGRDHSARALVLATGVKDRLPEIAGLSERWGKSIFHCPYCHGYELDRRPIGVIAVSEISLHHGLMLPDWGPTTLLLNGAFEPDEKAIQQLAERGTVVERTAIRKIEGHADVELEDGRLLSFAGLFVAPHCEVASPIAEQLGCAFEDGPMGRFVRTDVMKQTSIPGIAACGDAARASHSVSFAVGDGAMAGAMTHRYLMFGPL